MKIIATVLLALALTLGATTLASAQSTIDGYNEQGGQIQSQVESGAGGAGGTDGSGVAGTTQATDGGGSLPFTGLDLALLALAGGALVAVGVGMRRLTRAPESA
jgi:hypothetical protein